MNESNVIAPCKHHGVWVFDDPKDGTVQEPFVGGGDTIIDAMTRDLPTAEAGSTRGTLRASVRITTSMTNLHITGTDFLRGDEILIQLSDGRLLTFSLQKLLTLVPDSVTTEEDAKELKA